MLVSSSPTYLVLIDLGNNDGNWMRRSPYACLLTCNGKSGN